jgi:hypothetical protein
MNPKKITSLAYRRSDFPTKLNLVVVILLLGNFLAWQLAAFGQTTTSEPQNTSRTQATAVEHVITSPSDVLIVALKQGADRQQFDDLLQEVHGTYIRTINAGPNLQFLVVQAEPGKVTEVQQKLRKDKNVALVERNCQYRAQDTGWSNAEAASLHRKFANNHHHNFFAPHPHNTFPHNLNPHNPHNPGPPSQLTGSPDDPLLYLQWNLSFMHFFQARDLPAVNTSSVANYYFLDTGVVPNSDFPVVISQYDFSTDNSTGNKIPFSDPAGHGTLTSSITAWTDNKFGLAGLSNLEGQRCTLTMLQITADPQGFSSLLRIVNALSFIASTPGLPAGPINISFASQQGQPSLNSNAAIQAVAQQLILKNFLVVLGAGNNAEQDPSPELYCRRVAGINQSGSLASFSDFGPAIFAAAPATAIPGYFTGGGVFTADGTSFAAPAWCAAVATAMAAKPGINASQADSIIIKAASRTAQGLLVPNLEAALRSLGY